MSGAPAATSEITTIVRLSFYLRVLLLLASLVGFVTQPLSATALAAVLFVSVTSLAGVALDDVAERLQNHPIMAAADALVMAVLMAALGVDNPLVLVALSTCVVVGVLLSPVPATLSTIALVSGYVAAALSAASEPEDRDFLSLLGFPLTLVSVTALAGAFRVVALRKRQSERAFAESLSSTVAAQERARLARELHDSTAKTLQGLGLTARSMEHWVSRDPDRARQDAREMARDADEAVVRLRQLLVSLRQDDPGQPFDQSLASLAREAVAPHGTKVTLELEGVDVRAPNVRYELLSAAREAIVNAAVHSGADRIVVRLGAPDDDVRVEVEDRGRGFDPAVIEQRELAGHFGVRGCTERMASVGGEAHVTSVVGRGTRVVLRAPVSGLREDPRA